jgi:hypothetical protein
MDVSEQEILDQCEDWEVRARALIKVSDYTLVVYFFLFPDGITVRREAFEMGTTFHPAITSLCGRQGCLTWRRGKPYLRLW